MKTESSARFKRSISGANTIGHRREKSLPERRRIALIDPYNESVIGTFSDVREIFRANAIFRKGKPSHIAIIREAKSDG